jgi:LPS sulfotransferase NodH
VQNGRATPPRLILILSSERSGSTLTRVILGEHSSIVAPQELFLMRYPTYAAWREQKPVAIESVLEFFRLVGIERTEAEIARTCATMSTHDVYRWMLDHLGPDRRLLDKTPAYANDGESLRRSLPLEPFYIWLLRHPLGVIESDVRLKLRRRHTTDWRGIGRRLKDGVRRLAATSTDNLVPLARQRETKWVVQQTIIREFLAGIPAERQVRIRFEQLVREPEAAIGMLCEALGLEPEPAMLAACGGRRRMNVHLGDPNFHTHDRIDPRTADGWREHYSEEALTFETRRLMDALGISSR